MQPTFQSLVFRDLPRPDYADVALVALPAAVSRTLAGDPAAAARAVFDLDAIPLPVRLLFGARQVFVAALRIRSGASGRQAFAVREVVGNEAYIVTEEQHLDFHVGVAVEDDLLRVTTGVRLKGLRGQLYFVPVQVFHPLVTRAMMRAAVRRLSRA